MERSTPLISKQVKILFNVDISIHRNVNGEINPFDIKTSQNSYQRWYFHSQKCKWRDQFLWYPKQVKILFNGWLFHSQKCKWRDQPLWYQNKSKFFLTVDYSIHRNVNGEINPFDIKTSQNSYQRWYFHSQKCKWRDQFLWYQNKSKFLLPLRFHSQKYEWRHHLLWYQNKSKFFLTVDYSIHRNVNGEINPFDIKTSQNSF